MKHVLIKFSGNWADEMDIEGFSIISKDHWEYMKLEAEHTEFPIEMGVGTNEDIVFENAYEYIHSFIVRDISEEERKTIKKFFTSYDYGNVVWLEGNAPKSFYEKYGYCSDYRR